MAESTHNLREITAADTFIMSSIIGKLGIAKISDHIPADVRKDADFKTPTTMVDGKETELAEKYWTENAKRARDRKQIADQKITLFVIEMLLQNLSSCESDVYKLLANGTGKTTEDIKKMNAVEFLHLLDAYVGREAFNDFFTAALQSVSALGQKKDMLTAYIPATATPTE